MSGAFDSHVGYPNQNKMGDYVDMVSDNSGAHLAWANTLNGEQDVYYSHIVPYVVTGTDQISLNPGITIYPNPFTGTFNMEGLPKDSRVEIFTFVGQKVLSVNCSSSNCEIDMSARPAGLYFLKIIDPAGGSVFKKIIKH